MTHWRYLKKGGIIDVIAPGYGGSPADIPKIEAAIRALGFTPRVPKDIFAKHLLHSQDDAYRLDHLYRALSAKDSAAVWCYKGGYGTAKLIAKLAKKPKPKTPKLLIGFSDITALHLFLNQEWSWPTLHGPVLWQCVHGKVNEASMQAVKAAITGKPLLAYPVKPMNAKPRTAIRATITGGNLALLQTSIGTDWQADAKGRLLFIEEVDEAAYRVDRMLLHLAQAGLFKGIKGVILGDFTYHSSFEEELKIAKVLKAFAAEAKFPVFRLTGIGHAEDNMPLPFNTEAVISGSKLTVESGGVS